MNAARRGLASTVVAWAGLLVVGLIAAGTLTSAPLAAQTLEGVVRTADSGEGLAGATVRQEFGEGRFQAVRTEAGGSFQLELEGEPPYRIRVQRLGFGESVHTLEGAPDGPLEVVLERQPVELDGIAVEGEREPIEILLRPRQVVLTEEGVYSLNSKRVHSNCSYAALDSVVIRHPEDLYFFLMGPSERGEFTRHDFVHTEIYSHWDLHQNHTIPHPRLRREAYPCALHWTGAYSLFQRRNLPEIDLPTIPAASLASRWEQALPATLKAAAPAPDGGLSVWLDDRIVHLDAAGDERGSLEIDVPVWPDQDVPMGWLGDTLWVADPSRGEVRRYPDGVSDPEVIGARGRLAESPPPPVGRGGLAVPIPTAHADRWLWTRPAQPPLMPRPLPDDPPGPEFLSLNAEWRMHRVLTRLWPGIHELTVSTGDDTPVVMGPEPFEDHPLSAVAPDGSSVTFVIRDHPTLVLHQTQQVFRMDLDGDTVFSVERPAPNVRIDGATVDRFAEALGAHPDLQAALPFSGFETLLVAGSLYRPPFHPASSDVLVGTDGRTWLRGIDDGAGPVRWEVLGGNGGLVAVFELDHGIQLVAADQDGAWGVDPSGDTPRLIRYTLEPNG